MKLILQELRAFVFVVAELGEAPDLFGDLLVRGGVGVYELEDLGVVGRELGEGGGAGDKKCEQRQAGAQGHDSGSW
jgi:hypothetical protein